MSAQRIFHIAVEPPEILETALVKQVAVILKSDVYEVRLLLTGKVPRLVAHMNNVGIAESTVKNLASLGLTAFVVDDSELRKPIVLSSEFRAYSIQLGEKQVKFFAKRGAEKIISSGDLFMILYGKVNIPETTMDAITKVKLNVPATLITGGIPILRRTEENVEHVSFQSEHFLYLYGQKSLEPEIEVFESSFDYTFMGSKMTPSSSENLRALFSELKKTFPNVIVDTRLAEIAPIVQGFELENACKLIVLCYRAKSGIKH
jgi:hypothetical protein